jgi:hypothetical protein
MQQNGVRVGKNMTLHGRWNRIPLGTPAEMTIICASLKGV